MDVAGIDGCYGGWVAVRLDGTDVTTKFKEGFAEVWDECEGCERVLVDVPIGLVSAANGGVNDYRRRCDTLVRGRIDSPSSVFQVPIREAVDAWREAEADHERETEPDDRREATKQARREAARQAQRDSTGKGLTSQALSLLPKIAEVDTFVQEHDGGGRGRNSDLSNRLRESHPELCFTALNSGEPLEYPKSTRHSDAGLFERYRLLDETFARQGRVDEVGGGDTAALLWEALGSTSGQDVTFDDVLDAVALALTAAGDPATLPVSIDDVDTDEVLKRPMTMTYSPPGAFEDGDGG